MVLDNDAATTSAAASSTSSYNAPPNIQTRPSAQFITPLTIVRNDIELFNRCSTIAATQIESAYAMKIDQAREKTKRSFDKSKLLENAEYVLPRFEMKELVLGKVLGKGGFGTVLEINAIYDVAPPQDDGGKDERIVFEIYEFEERKKQMIAFRVRSSAA
jgi:hypothetical protein